MSPRERHMKKLAFQAYSNRAQKHNLSEHHQLQAFLPRYLSYEEGLRISWQLSPLSVDESMGEKWARPVALAALYQYTSIPVPTLDLDWLLMA